MFTLVAIKELGGEEPEGAQPAPPGIAEFDHEGWKYGRGISGAAKNITSWATIMQRVSLRVPPSPWRLGPPRA